MNRVRFVDDEGNSEEATASIVVGAEPVFDCGVVIGKVFDDRNQNGYQDPMPARSAAVTNQDIFSGKFGGKLSTPPVPQGEPGIPGVRVATVNGELITTDAHGRFSVPCAALPRDIGQNFTLKLDTRSLPTGYRLTTENPRTVRLTAGKMTELNFGATISRLVRVDVAANAFVAGTDQPNDRFNVALAGAIPQFANAPVTLRISYLDAGEGERQIRTRMQAVESLVRQYWRNNGTYRLVIEKTTQRVK